METSLKRWTLAVAVVVSLLAVAAPGVATVLLLGDMNCDGVVDAGDIQPMQLAVSDPEAYDAQYPSCTIKAGDMNQDEQVNQEDLEILYDQLGLGVPAASPLGLAALAALLCLVAARALSRSA